MLQVRIVAEFNFSKNAVYFNVKPPENCPTAKRLKYLEVFTNI
jgi:hypothetical protein